MRSESNGTSAGRSATPSPPPRVLVRSLIRLDQRAPVRRTLRRRTPELIDPATFVLRLSGDTPLSRGSRPTLDIHHPRRALPSFVIPSMPRSTSWSSPHRCSSSRRLSALGSKPRASTPATSSQLKRATKANSRPVSSTSTHTVRALRLGPRRMCILAECIRLLSGRCGASLAGVRCPGRRGRGFPGRSLRDVHPSRRWCVRSIRSRAWFRRVLHRSWPCA